MSLEPSDRPSTPSLARDARAGIGIFLSLFWWHRWPREAKSNRASYIALTLFTLMILGMLYYWFTAAERVSV
jgi:hypothetical protein